MMQHNPTNAEPPVQTIELKIRPRQIALVGFVLLAVLGSALLVLRLIDVIILLFVSLVIAATLRPMVSALRRRGIPKGLAVSMIYLSILGAIVGLFMLVIPSLVIQVEDFFSGFPKMYADLVNSLKDSPNALIQTIPQWLPAGDELSTQLGSVSGEILTGMLGIGAGILSFLMGLLTIIVLSVYLALDQLRLERFWLSLAPTSRRPVLLAIWREIETHLGHYVRGQLLLMASIGVLASLGYLVIGLPYPLALGVLAGMLEFVPLIGPTLGSIPALLVALTISPETALFVLIYSIIIQVAENNILIPRLMGRSVGVSPVVVILSILVFSSLLGIAGAFLAIPLSAILQVIMNHLVLDVKLVDQQESDDASTNLISTMRAHIRRMRAEGLVRLRTGSSRINLASGDSDDVDSRADQLLGKADQALSDAVQTEATDTVEVHVALLAEVDLAIHQAGEMVEEIEFEAIERP